MAQNQQVEFHVDDDFHTKLPYTATPTKLEGVYLNPTPPDDFDVNKATQDELTEQGLLWRKPSSADHPVVHDIWDRFFSRNWQSKNRIVPEFEPQIGRTHYLKDKPVKQGNTSTYLGTVWSGAGNNIGTWTTCLGSWIIPTVSVPPEPQGLEGGWNSSSWVGIDGMFTSNDVLQAGVEQKVDASGFPSYIAWYEWYAPPVSGSPPYIYQTNIPNFFVQPGQMVYCCVHYINHTAGCISFANDATGEHFSITLAPPPGASFNASSCEWIMEAPDGGEPVSSLPRFTPVIFTGGIACGPGDITIPGDCDTLNIQNVSGTVLTNATVNGETATITFIG
jgi:Peptidase A4 family